MNDDNLEEELEAFVLEYGRGPRSMREIGRWEAKREKERILDWIDGIQAQLASRGIHIDEGGRVIYSRD